MGRPVQYCGKEVKTAVMRGKYMLKVSDEALKDIPGDEEVGFKRYIRKEAIGPVLVLFAWNVSCPNSFDLQCMFVNTNRDGVLIFFVVSIFDLGQFTGTSTTCW